MAIYPYRNAKGERREVSASMKSPPPSELVFTRRGYREAKAGDNADAVWTRIYAECLPRIDVRDYEVKPMSGDRNAPPIRSKADIDAANGAKADEGVVQVWE